MIPAEWLEQAAFRITPHIRCTSLTYDPQLNVYIKWENQQVTGSFKARGALNKVLSLQDWERTNGLVTASAGNHGQGVALAGKITGAPVTVFASEYASPVKLDAIRALGARLRLVMGGYPDAELAGLNFASGNRINWVSPYNDGQVIAGQGTLALEILQQHPEAGTIPWLSPVSGGGLISGIGLALKEHFPQSRLVGVQAAASPFMHSLYYRGTQMDTPDLPSLADGLTGAIEHDSVTIPLVHRYVDEIILIDEVEIERAIAYAWHTHAQTIEGSGAVTLAAVLSGKVQAPAVVVISGGNIQPDVHKDICARVQEAA